MPLSRGGLVRRSAISGDRIALVGAVGVLATAPGALASDVCGGEPGYGPLEGDPAGVVALPAGFSYRVVTRAGGTTPSHHGGIAAFAGTGGATLLVSSHGIGGPPASAGHPVPHVAELVYDPGAAGGCTVVEVTADGVGEWVGIAGTSTNRAGGATPWGTWLTCEETEDRAGRNGMTKDHGYVFEVDPHDRHANRHPKPLKALGRYAHEAVVVDPRRGHLYLTEDAAGPGGLLYRWTPPRGFQHGRGRLAALGDTDGALQAFRCFDSRGRFVDDLSRATVIGTRYGVDWVDVPDRDARTTSVRGQFTAGQVTRARKLEGMWWADGGAYVVSSFAREESPVRHDGAVWFYDPSRRTITLKVLLGVTTAPEGAGGPDSVTVSPYGGLVVAGDGAGAQHLFGALDDGRTYPLARNELNIGTAEEPEYGAFTGVAFSPDGGTLFAGIRTPGVMVAITGPWRRRPARR